MRGTVAIYIRLSLEDNDLVSGGKPESESITNQRNMLTEYIKNVPEFEGAEILEFCDDGWSGKNFDRPSVKRLIEAARNGAIQCVVVKDLSRFGRDYLAVGNYVSRVFPFLGVRFISVNDHFDSNRPGDIDSLDTSFKMLMNDMYSRDLSRKVLSAKKNLVERGVYINPVAPYGYRKDPQDKHHLMIDPVAGAVVHRIFSLVAAGESTREIACILNREQVATPAQYKIDTPSFHANWTGGSFWIEKMVSGIVRDRQYMGSLVWGKRVRHQIGVHQQLTARVSDWHIADGHHDPIVSKELFDRAQEGLGGAYKQNARHSAHIHPLSRKVYCGVCGKAIVRRGKAAPCYLCATPNTLPSATCCREKIYVDEILDAATTAIQTQARYAVELKRMMDAQKKQAASKLFSLQSELQTLQSQREQLTGQLRELYEQFAEGAITRTAYGAQKAIIQERLNQVSEQIADTEMHLFKMKSGNDSFVEHFSKYANLDELTEEIAADLLERITIWPDGRLEISLNYLNELDEASVFLTAVIG